MQSVSKEVEDLIHELQGFDLPVSVVVAGAGTSLIHWLHSVPGASKIMTKCEVLYSVPSSRDVVKLEAPAVSSTTSDVFASHAHGLALRFAGRREREQVSAYSPWDRWEYENAGIGIGITGALATNRERRGPDHAFISVLYGDDPLPDWASSEILLVKGTPREEQEEMVSLAALRLVVGALHDRT